MINQEPTYNLEKDKDLSKFLLGSIRDLRLKRITIEEGDGIAKLATAYTKNEVMQCLKKRIRLEEAELNFEKEKRKLLEKNN